jgi:hypothetical protein
MKRDISTNMTKLGIHVKISGSEYVGPQIGMNPIPLWGLPDLEY